MGRKVNRVRSPNSDFEKKLWRQGYSIVAGVDEVGRGSLAGPIVAGCVSFPKNFEFSIPRGIRIDDSKNLPRFKENDQINGLEKIVRLGGLVRLVLPKLITLELKKQGKLHFERRYQKSIQAFY